MWRSPSASRGRSGRRPSAPRSRSPALAGISVFATGGIGGVHRGAEVTGDVSADLDALASWPVITVSAGAKAFLDLARTLEYLETRGVPGARLAARRLPGVLHPLVGSARSRTASRTPTEVARIFAARTRPMTGVLVAVPIPVDDELDAAQLDEVLAAALRDADDAGIVGAAVTPFVLGRIAEATAGESVPANLALAEHNAAVAAEIAVALAAISR